LVVSLLGALICQLVSIVGLILGIVALNEINGSHGRVTGRGMAIAGIVIGALGLAFFGVAFIVFGLGAGGFWS